MGYLIMVKVSYLTQPAALDWIERQNLDYSQCWVSGFSFGSLICMQLIMRRLEENTIIQSLLSPNQMYRCFIIWHVFNSGQVIYSENEDSRN